MRSLLSRRKFLQATGVGAASLAVPSLLRGEPAYSPTWDSLAKHRDPAWFADAKFGIYFHWGIYSVPAFDNEWYSRNMYIPGHAARKFHELVYGPPAKFGYKDFLPLFRAEKFDADEWAELIRKAGAKFAGPVTEHADGFSMWDSRVNPWNAARLGPRRDVVSEMARALRNQGLKFLATLHHQWLWGWYPTVNRTLDTGDPRYSGLYGPPAPGSPFNYEHGVTGTPPPPTAFQDQWAAKTKEVIDKYQPDFIYFDSRLFIIGEPRRRDLLAYYYSRAEEWGREVGLSYKDQDLPKGVAIPDFERGRLASLVPFEWLTDDAVDWNSWCHVQNPHYKSAARIVGQLVDTISKNGKLLLDITPTAEGVIPDAVRERLLAIGKWLDVNGEAVYGTRPWKVFGEGPTKLAGGAFTEEKTPDFTARDIRFTCRANALYAIAMACPQNSQELVIASLDTGDALLAKGQVAAVSLLGSDQKITWTHDARGLAIALPTRPSDDLPAVFKIVLKE